MIPLANAHAKMDIKDYNVRSYHYQVGFSSVIFETLLSKKNRNNCCFNFFSDKVLVITGKPFDNGRKTEILDLMDPAFTCSGIQDFPVDLFYGTGGLIGEIPFVCGGKAADRYNQCYSLQETGEWKEDQTATLNSARSNAAFGSVIINDKLVVAGGTNGSYLSTIELAAPNTKSTTLSMELPLGIYGSCVVPWSNNTFMVIGGRSEDYFYRAETYYFNLETNKVTNGPALKTARRNHACHEMVINGELFVVVTGGEKQSSLSTEMLSKSSMNNEWEKSKI